MNKKLKCITALVTVILLVFGFTANAYAVSVNSTINNIEWMKYVEDAMKADDAPGLVLVAVSESEVAYMPFGYSDLKNETMMTAETVLQIGSCSKAFTALAVFLLQERGQLSIEDSVSDYIPWWHVTYQGQDVDVKIWQLINHCAGIPNGKTMAKYEFGTDHSLNEKSALIAKDLELSAAPGSVYEYCNLDYVIMAYLVEVVSGMYFDDFVEQNILYPLGMTNSGYDIPTAQGYISFMGRSVPYDAPRMKGAEGEGFLITTASDMSLWLRAQLGQLDGIPDEIKNAIAATHKADPAHLAADKGETYYNGWIFDEDGVLHHSGMNPNFTSFSIVDPKRGVAVMAISNCVTDSVEYASTSFYKLSLGSDFVEYPAPEPNMMVSLDKVCSIGCLIFTALILLCFIAAITQKKRIAKKSPDASKAKGRMIAKLVILIPLLALSIILPYIAGFMVGYDTFFYKMFLYWGTWSMILMCILMAVTFLLLIILSISRYFRIRKINM